MMKRPAVLAVTLLTLTGLAMAPGTSPSSAAESPPPAPTPFGDVAPAEVTLITGDRVSVSSASGQRVVTVTDAQGVPTGFRMHEEGGKLLVVPEDAAPLIAEGRVDERLFDVAGLIADGYDDARTSSIPLIATYPTRSAAAGSAAPDGARISQRLPGLRMAAMRTPKSEADSFWKDLTKPKAARSAAPSKVWLDAKVTSTVTDSIEQVRAPEAWEAGYTGKGVKVAVLDSGIDANHPDLAGRIVASQDFTGSSSGTADRHGHGTHAASSVVGDGSASGGDRREGVAPDASLIIGKVLGDTGSGPTSGVLAGMQWAVNSGADIVSMSLGAPVPVCADPLAAAVDQLSASSDTLFVVAAGNDGPGVGTVASPGCAPSALTVAADDSALKIAPFSGRGPVEDRDGHLYLKPDMAAPGVGIVGARAAGTSLGRPIDEHYTSLSGTSMATPHVAGAAAVLAERSPGLTGQQIKAHLMSTVRPDPLNAPLAEGTGFLDVHQVVTSTVSGPGYIDGDELTWPHDPSRAVEREVTWTNSGDTPVTLNLKTKTYDASGAPAPEAMATLAQPTVTVPAHGTATVGLRLSVVEPLPAGGYGEITGRITATSADGSQRAVTSYGFFAQPNTVTVTFRGTTRGSSPAGTLSYVNLISTDRGDATRVYFRDGVAKVTVPAGNYDLDAAVYGFDKGVNERSLYRMARSLGILYRPGLALTESTEIDLDARDAHQVEVSASQPLESRTSSVRYQTTAQGTTFASTLVAASNILDVAVSDVPAGEWEDARVDLVTRAYAPLLSVSTSGGTRLEPLYAKYSPVDTEGVSYLPESGSAQLVDVGSGTPEELAAVDVKDRFVLVNLGSDDSQSTIKLQQVTTDAIARKAAGVMVSHEFAGRWTSFVKDDIPVLAITTDEYQALRKELAGGRTQLQWTGTPDSPYVYNMHVPFTDGIPADQHHELKEDSLAQVEESWSSQLRDLQYGDGLAIALERGGQATGAGVIQPVLAPTQRTAYYSTGEAGWVHWGTTNLAAGGDTMAGGVAHYESARQDEEHWYEGPIRPQPATNLLTGELAPLAEREGDVLRTVVPNTGDDAGHVAFSAMTDQYTATLTRDGSLVGRSNNPLGAWSVPAGAGRFELTAEQRRRTDLPVFRTWSLSPKITTRWSFDSASTVQNTALPLLVPSYDMSLDTYNRAQPTTSYRVELSAPAQPGYDGHATGLTAQVSYDDGATWRAVETRRDGTSWVAMVDNKPASGGFVSLRVTATGSDDTTVEQTLVRAYAVR